MTPASPPREALAENFKVIFEDFRHAYEADADHHHPAIMKFMELLFLLLDSIAASLAKAVAALSNPLAPTREPAAASARDDAPVPHNPALRECAGLRRPVRREPIFIAAAAPDHDATVSRDLAAVPTAIRLRPVRNFRIEPKFTPTPRRNSSYRAHFRPPKPPFRKKTASLHAISHD
ncbi:hypothetical protein SIL87_12870 [Acidiphilium acidophilum]|uniref:Uncharacterized protein n=1 Tax=Acidiphilium acidophilum TaxID=76588 RepID=A0AAW9DTL9_ACIAO|nr:hypothetical protein [Acidiphilium acidophilum]